MIIDTIDNWREYAQGDPRLRPGFVFITETFEPSMKDGRYDLPDGAGYANVESYQTRPAAEGKFEAHRKYADIQYLLTGAEVIEWSPLSGLEVVDPYGEQRDAGFYRASGDVTCLVLTPRRFAVFFPPDAHKPGCAIAEPVDVRKIIAKIRL